MSETAVQCFVGKRRQSDQQFLERWLEGLISEVKIECKEKWKIIHQMHPVAHKKDEIVQEICSDAIKIHLHESVQKLYEAILNDPQINMYFHEMFWQQFLSDKYKGGYRISCWQDAILMIDHVMTKAPKYSRMNLVIVPFTAILNWCMGTTSGNAAFLDDKVNAIFKNILNEWEMYLSSPESCYVLNDDPRSGWFGKDAMEDMPNFVQDFECDPKVPHYGFKSWDDFFTRRLKKGVRPVASPKDDYIVANACESSPFRISTNVKKTDFFWIKGEMYSLGHILKNSEYVKQFIGGTIYQGFLSARNYHRWHSPVSGKIVRVELIDGTYFSQLPIYHGENKGIVKSQSYLAHVAARAIIYIHASNIDIGLMVFVAIGITDVSTNEVTVQEGQHVEKGDELGMFHYGGSTHLLIFGSDVNIQFDIRGQQPSDEAFKIPVRSRIATVTPK